MPSKSNYICVKCEKEMMPAKVGVLVEEHRKATLGRTSGSGVEWLPYKIWTADVLECPECGAQILAGFPDRPVAHHHEDNYAEEQKKVEYHIR